MGRRKRCNAKQVPSGQEQLTLVQNSNSVHPRTARADEAEATSKLGKARWLGFGLFHFFPLDSTLFFLM